jgi:glycosyltransferase involved in cell wall biosynthesis
VLKKVVSQAESWRRDGHEAKLFLISSSTKVWTPAQAVIGGIVSQANKFSRGIAGASLMRDIERWSPDVMYARFDPRINVIANTMRRVPTILELNTDDVTEYRTYLPAYRYWYHRLVRGKILSRAIGFVCVTGEIEQRLQQFGKPTAVIANGVDLSAYESLPPVADGPLRLVFAGSPGAQWHGVDKMVALARKLPHVQIDLIGPSPDSGQPSNVTAHGMLGRNDYQTLIARADVGIGTLAMHRNGMDEGSTLKVREYLAFGLPCVIGYRDTDFPTPVPFILQLPNTASNAVDAADDIEAFCTAWRGRRVKRSEISHLDTSVKESQRLEFISTVVGDRAKLSA